MSNVSLLGSAGGTITLPITSANNAVVAQKALLSINGAVAAGSLTEIVQATAVLAPVTEPSVVVLQPQVALPPIQLGNGYVAAVLDGPQMQDVVTGVMPNETIVSGISGAVVGNLAANTQVFLGGGSNVFLELGGIGFDPSAWVWLDGNGYLDLSSGETTVFAGTGAAANLVNNGDGANVIDFQEINPNAAANLIEIGGNRESAATVHASGADLVALQNGGVAIINANQSHVTVYGAPGNGWNGGGSVTLYGGTGRDSVDSGSGFFQAGTFGNSLLSSSTVAGAATLVGGGDGDTLAAYGSGDVMIAGPGNETLIGGGLPVVAFGYAGVQHGHAMTSMVGGANGGDVFYIGNGETYITANHESGSNVFAKLTDGGGSVVITGFVSEEDAAGVPQASPDKISLWWNGGNYALVNNAAPQAGQVTYSYTSLGNTPATEIRFGDGATWTLLGTMVHPGDFM
jgi:hypothetical protein